MRLGESSRVPHPRPGSCLRRGIHLACSGDGHPRSTKAIVLAPASAKLVIASVTSGHPLASGAGCKGGSVDLNGSTGPFPFVDHAASLFFIRRHADGPDPCRRRWCGAGCVQAFRTARSLHNLLAASAAPSPLAGRCGFGLATEEQAIGGVGRSGHSGRPFH
jgi:hypothetical protein